MLILMSLVLADPDAATMMKVAAQRSQPCADAGCGEPARRSPFRVEASDVGGYDRKAAALAITGRDCERIGKLACTGKQRTVYTTAY